MSRFTRKKRFWIPVFVLFCIISFVFYYKKVTRLDPPTVPVVTLNDTQRIANPEGTFYKLGANTLQKNEFGLWEMYVEGNAYERGRAHGILSKELIGYQEGVFVKQIRQLVPNASYLRFLNYGLLYFNKDLDEHIPDEYLQEIYGVSQSHPDTFDFIGEKYARILNYHAAHDIGHAMQQYMLVGCTSFSAWSSYTADSQLIVGRNFDFYAGDDFARNKVVSFFRPEKGYKFMTVSWPGFIGAVSGMNEHGLALTINASAGNPPLKTRTPIALLTREILQFARNIDEAVAIARKRETFVSESILLASAEDGRSIIIEKSPDTLGIYTPPGARLSCSNHYQSAAFAADEKHLENIAGSDSPYRFARMNELQDQHPGITVQDAADILRNKEGLFHTDIGLGNQKSVNQLICHHSVIIKPQERKIWVSAPPYNLGTYVCYDLRTVFDNMAAAKAPSEFFTRELNLAPDPFLYTKTYKRFELFRQMKPLLLYFTKHPDAAQPIAAFFEKFEAYNPNWYHTHVMLGDYYAARGEHEKARKAYQKALKLEIASKGEKEATEKKLEELER
ncbi:MAG: C45 family autoproteolytic acyltransferase/hydrolase [Flavobacteriales bacterium]